MHAVQPQERSYFKNCSLNFFESEQENQNSSKNGSYFLTSLFPPSTSPQLEAFFVIAHGVSGESYTLYVFLLMSVQP